MAETLLMYPLACLLAGWSKWPTREAHDLKTAGSVWLATRFPANDVIDTEVALLMSIEIVFSGKIALTLYLAVPLVPYYQLS